MTEQIPEPEDFNTHSISDEEGLSHEELHERVGWVTHLPDMLARSMNDLPEERRPEIGYPIAVVVIYDESLQLQLRSSELTLAEQVQVVEALHTQTHLSLDLAQEYEQRLARAAQG